MSDKKLSLVINLNKCKAHPEITLKTITLLKIIKEMFKLQELMFFLVEYDTDKIACYFTIKATKLEKDS